MSVRTQLATPEADATTYTLSLFDDPTFSDLFISCLDPDTHDPFNLGFHVHKAIVCRIEWFRKACTAGFAEQENDTINFPEDRSEIVELLLQHIYGMDVTPVLDTWVSPLLRNCGRDLLMDAFMLADRIDVPSMIVLLENSLMEYFRSRWQHSDDIYDTETWEAIERVFSLHPPNFVRLQVKITAAMGDSRVVLTSQPEKLQERLMESPNLSNALAMNAIRGGCLMSNVTEVNLKPPRKIRCVASSMKR